MSNDNKTLADVHPGGRVRLGDRLPPLPCTDYNAYSDGSEPLFNAEQMRDYARAALSAQPSPGGQDALDCIGRIEEAIEFRVPHDIYAAVHGELAELKAALAGRQPVEVSEGAFRAAASRQTASAASNATAEALIAAARQPSKQPDSVALGEATEFCSEKGAMQPMGEPVAYTSETQLKAVRLCGDGIMSQRNAKWDIPLYLRPAQAVDLPYSLDADPAGIRALVADAITGTLMVGAQGHTPPPAGHWAEPFWQAALADAALQAKMREALWAAARSLRTIADSTKETEFLETAHEIRAYANSRAICAEQAVIDSKAVRNG